MKHLLFFILLFCTQAMAQQKYADTVLHVFNEDLLATTKDKAVFTGYAVKTGDRWAAQVYDEQTRLVARGSYASKQCKDKDGWFTFYNAEGKRAANGQYFRDRKQGNWRIWYTNGQLRDSIDYEKDRPNGVYFTYFEDGTLSGRGNFKDGIEDGTWTWYHPNGQISSIEEYVKGRLAGQQCFDVEGRKQLNDCKLFSEPKTTENFTLRKLILDQTQLPKDPTGKLIEGYVTVGIHIDNKGTIQELTILQSDDPALDSLARKLINSHQWHPAYNHNRAVPFIRVLHLPFYKEKNPHFDFANADQGPTGNDGRMPVLSTGKSAKFRDKYGMGSY